MSHKKSKLEKKKSHLQELYFSWGKVYCPALNKDVHFTRLGWDHLMEIKKRTGVERLKRLDILPLAKKLISITTTIQGRRFQDGYQTYNFIAYMDGPKIDVVVSESKGVFSFFSVFIL